MRRRKPRARKRETARAQIAEQLATIEQQRAVIRETSVPILPVTANAWVMPLVGALDTASRLLQTQALHTLERSAARVI